MDRDQRVTVVEAQLRAHGINPTQHMCAHLIDALVSTLRLAASDGDACAGICF